MESSSSHASKTSFTLFQSIKFPEILYNDRSDTRLTEEELTDLQQRLVDFLKFLRKNQSAFFLSTYPENEDIETSTNKQDD
ncbi:hypothetical protein L484_006798 [Morus notabilis]|uniref:Uncharacterized protein n=1 Tax=Morus notabilis TaxID=981085 RepID=W9S565_9ROSA|nr:hypothetical protein L484_006798 [Morus notabilis]